MLTFIDIFYESAYFKLLLMVAYGNYMKLFIASAKN